MYQAINKQTREVLAENFAYAPLENEYAGEGEWVVIRNTETGVEWDAPEA